MTGERLHPNLALASQTERQMQEERYDRLLEEIMDWEGPIQPVNLGKKVLNGAISSDNRLDSQKAVKTQGTQQVNFNGGTNPDQSAR